MRTKDNLFLWIPRVLCIISILFISMFALDAFDNRLPILKQIEGFLIHLIPSIVLTLVLIISWKWKLIGGIIFASIGFITGPLIFYHNLTTNHFSIIQSIGIVSIISLPFIIIGAFFIVDYFYRKEKLGI